MKHWLKRWLSEPLLHFLVIGAGLFVLFYQVVDPETVSDNRIVISEADVDRLITLFERKWQRLPAARELDGLVEAAIREEVLYREALAMGLDDGDTIVRRRMAQKVEFLFQDLADATVPTDEELQDFLSEHRATFTQSARTSFTHVYLNVDKHGDGVETEAWRLLAQLREDQDSLDLDTLGDPFMFGYAFNKQSEHQIARMFGHDFAKLLTAIEPGTWGGPIASGYGLHLVYVSERIGAQLPPLAEIRDAVLREWMAARRLEANKAFYKNLRDRYTVVVERPHTAMGNVTIAESMQ